MKYIVNFFTSTRTMIVLLFVFAVSIGWATFIENDYGTEGARSLVYNSKWFELLLLLGLINIIAVTLKNKLYKKEKITIFIFHIAFVVIIIGAGITRYFSQEGNMHIREGQTTNIWYTSQNHISINIEDEKNTKSYSYPVLFSGIAKNRFNKHIQFDNKNIQVRLEQFIPKAEQTLIPGTEGLPTIHLVKIGAMGREDVFLGLEDMISLNGMNLLFVTAENISLENSIFIKQTEAGTLQFKAPVDVMKSTMSTQSVDTLIAGIWHPFNPMTVYNINATTVVMKGYFPFATIGAQPVDDREANLPSALLMEVKSENSIKKVVVWGQKENIGKPESIVLNGIKVSISYGTVAYKLPFNLKLNDFILKRYPGSESPSWFESNVTLTDSEKGINSDNRIYMNHILDHRGYRFYQASYDMDEKGTILSVNRDGLGTTVTYLGYILMAVGMALSLINKKSRFRSGDIQKSGSRAVITLFIIGLSFISNSSFGQETVDKVGQNLPVINKDHAEIFGRILVQDNGGRIEPINTLSSEVLRKVARKDRYNGQTSDQVLIGMMTFPEFWQNEPMIRIGNEQIIKMLGLPSKYASFNDFFKDDMYGGYLLKSYVEDAYRKKPGYRSKFDNEIIRIDERVNVCYLVYTGTLLRIFPDSNDSTSKWYSAVSAANVFKNDDSIFVKLVLSFYMDEINKSVATNNWQMPNDILKSINAFQNKYSKDVLPVTFRVKAEYFYNKSNIFSRLTRIYLLVGIILLLLQFINIFQSKFNIRYFTIGATVIIVAVFMIHTSGLALRWYIAGHAPWSNGYEALVFIAWATILAGLMFARKSGITISATAILAALILQTAHLSWMDPQVTNLVPVLKSYWLVIHVAVITASYGFVGLGALLALINLLFMTFENNRNKTRIEEQIADIENVIQKALIIGLYLLTIGSFLGGVWANESWGRYWGWDPKETWALITIIAYAIILHVRLVPGLTGRVLFNILSLIGFATVLMTYFGVNYYLSGLHSYAKGDPVPVPHVVYYSVAVVIVLSLLASYNQYRLKKMLE